MNKQFHSTIIFKLKTVNVLLERLKFQNRRNYHCYSVDLGIRQHNPDTFHSQCHSDLLDISVGRIRNSFLRNILVWDILELFMLEENKNGSIFFEERECLILWINMQLHIFIKVDVSSSCRLNMDTFLELNKLLLFELLTKTFL